MSSHKLSVEFVPVFPLTVPLYSEMESYPEGGAEECNSCESGWTMYIASPMHADDSGDDSGDDYDGDDGGIAAGDDVSDDSMASDASSGPSHRQQFNSLGHEIDNSKDEDENDNDESEDDRFAGECSGYSCKRSYKRKEKHTGRIEAKKENPTHRARKTDPACTKSKVRKTSSTRKGK